MLNGCLLPPSFVSGPGGLGFLGLCWHWLRLGSHRLLIPALLLPHLRLWLALWRLGAWLLLPPQRPPPSVLLLLLLLLLLPLLYLHQLLKAFRGCWVHNKPVLQGKETRGLLRSPIKDKMKGQEEWREGSVRDIAQE